MTLINPVHLLFVAIVALIVLGPKRLPELARSLGEGLRELRGALEGGTAPRPDEEVEMPQSPPAAAVQAAPVPPVVPSVEPPDGSGGEGAGR
jgi:sec-independent protein translocase protein TatA